MDTLKTLIINAPTSLRDALDQISGEQNQDGVATTIYMLDGNFVTA